VSYIFDTDVLSNVIGREPLLHLIRRVAAIPAEEQYTTAITAGELRYGARKRGSVALVERIDDLLTGGVGVLPFGAEAAAVYGDLRVALESAGTPLAEPDLRIASICVQRDDTLVTGNERRFARVPGLRMENWLVPDAGG
jgi:tRNA(fMet)-specific endonuclease VapC